MFLHLHLLRNIMKTETLPSPDSSVLTKFRIKKKVWSYGLIKKGTYGSSEVNKSIITV